MTPEPAPVDGDIVVAQRSHECGFVISRFPGPPQLSVEHIDEALREAARLASGHGVSAWFTANHTHFMPLSTVHIAPGADDSAGKT